jgi:AAA family ATPase
VLAKLYEVDFRYQAILVSSSLLLTARIADGAHGYVFPLSTTVSAKLPRGIPPLGKAQEVEVVKLKEISQTGGSALDSTARKGASRQGWLTHLLRETLG